MVIAGLPATHSTLIRLFAAEMVPCSSVSFWKTRWPARHLIGSRIDLGRAEPDPLVISEPIADVEDTQSGK